MSDSSTTTMIATFGTREAADLAVERLVQEYGVDRSDIFVRSAGVENSSGVNASGGDAPSIGMDGRRDAVQGGEIEVSADVRTDQIQALQRTFGDLDALRVTAK